YEVRTRLNAATRRTYIAIGGMFIQSRERGRVHLDDFGQGSVLQIRKKKRQGGGVLWLLVVDVLRVRKILNVRVLKETSPIGACRAGGRGRVDVNRPRDGRICLIEQLEDGRGRNQGLIVGVRTHRIYVSMRGGPDQKLAIGRSAGQH